MRRFKVHPDLIRSEIRSHFLAASPAIERENATLSFIAVNSCAKAWSMTFVSSPLSGETIVNRLKALARHTDVPGEMTRLSLSPSHRKAADEVLDLFRAAGMTARIDPLGSVTGRYASDRNDAKTLLIGSHIDTVPNGGIYDGPLGVMAGLAIIEELARLGRRLPFDIELFAFSDEEGVRFPSPFSSSRAVAGTFDEKLLAEKDKDGITRAEALKAFGCDPVRWAEARRDPDNLLGYLELHIEQGPVLEANDEVLGVVSAIVGLSRGRMTMTGKAGHAGTTPMDLRKDALTAAAEIVLMLEKMGRETDDLVATVGNLTVSPGAGNVIPGKVSLVYDIRSPKDAVRVRALALAMGRAREIADERGLEIDIEMTSAMPAAASDQALMEVLSAAIARQASTPRQLVSGAGHDAMIFRNICPQAMLFVRSKDGLSHHPDEFTTEEDIGKAAQALYDAVLAIAEKHAG
jgi:allantoate deiminase